MKSRRDLESAATATYGEKSLEVQKPLAQLLKSVG